MLVGFSTFGFSITTQHENHVSNDNLQPLLAAPPHAVRLDVGQVGEKTITVRWSPGPDGGRPITGYRIDYKERTGAHSERGHVVLTYY